MTSATVCCFYLLHLMLLPLVGYANEFIINDCKQMFHNEHPCNKQEFLAYRWQIETCGRLESQNELHTYRTCLGHSGINIQGICNVCGFFTYPMVCGPEKSRRLLRCLGDQFIVQGHSEEIVIAGRLCGNLVRSHDTSTTMVTPPFRPTVATNTWTTPRAMREEPNFPPFQPQRLSLNENNSLQPFRPETALTSKTKAFRTTETNMTAEDRLSHKDTQLRQRKVRPGARPDRPKSEVVHGEEEDQDDVSVEADAQEKALDVVRTPHPAPETMQKSVQNVVDQLATPTERELPVHKELPPGSDQILPLPVQPSLRASDESRNYQMALYDLMI